MYQPSDSRSVLARLRALPPGRPSDSRAALRLAERQAALLNYLTALGGQAIDERVAMLPCIAVVYADLPISGLSHWDGERWVITISKHEPRTRQRFTTLHEYKHIVDHFAVNERYRDRPGASAARQMEQTADYFAGCALVPSAQLRDAWLSGATDPTELADLFDVSLPAIQVRLRQVGLISSRPRPTPLQSSRHPNYSERLAA